MSNAAGIQNLLRNIGGSIGISYVSTMLVRFSLAHQVFLNAAVFAAEPSLSRTHQRPATTVTRDDSMYRCLAPKTRQLASNLVLQQAELLGITSFVLHGRLGIGDCRGGRLLSQVAPRITGRLPSFH